MYGPIMDQAPSHIMGTNCKECKAYIAPESHNFTLIFYQYTPNKSYGGSQILSILLVTMEISLQYQLYIIQRIADSVIDQGAKMGWTAH